MAHASRMEKMKQHDKKLRETKTKKGGHEYSDKSEYLTLKWDIERGLPLNSYKQERYDKLKKMFEK
tara:strand:+ start:538 stop:735 length:198 start_codon:yes stop_codon:yes gene_type:complete